MPVIGVIDDVIADVSAPGLHLCIMCLETPESLQLSVWSFVREMVPQYGVIVLSKVWHFKVHFICRLLSSQFMVFCVFRIF